MKQEEEEEEEEEEEQAEEDEEEVAAFEKTSEREMEPTKTTKKHDPTTTVTPPGEALPSTDPDQYLFGWCSDVGSGCAWRAKLVKGRPQKKEFTNSIVEPGSVGKLEQYITAVFSDKMQAEIKDMPTDVFLARYRKRASASADASTEAGAHAGGSSSGTAPPSWRLKSKKGSAEALESRTLSDGSVAAIFKKKDHQWVWKLSINNKPILYISCNRPRSFEVMQTLLQRLGEGKVEPNKEALRMLREQLLKEISGNTIKKPAPKAKRQATQPPDAQHAQHAHGGVGAFKHFDDFMGGGPPNEFTMMS